VLAKKERKRTENLAATRQGRPGDRDAGLQRGHRRAYGAPEGTAAAEAGGVGPREEGGQAAEVIVGVRRCSPSRFSGESLLKELENDLLGLVLELFGAG
jgi:hypothetical protein